MISPIKRLASRLPLRYQQELKRLHFANQIRNQSFKTAEPHDREYARLHEWVGPGDWVLDVGANVGNYTARLSEIVGGGGRVFAFEPVPENFELLTANIARYPLRNVTLLNVAVCDQAGVCGMAMPKLETGLDNRYMAAVTTAKADVTVIGLPIDALQLPHPVAFVKIDVEGHELSALKGMKALIGRDHPVLLVEGRSEDVASYLQSFGYDFEEAPDSPNRVWMWRQRK